MTKPSPFKKKAYLPTREQILAECRRIQDGWTDEERRKRTSVQNVSPDYGRERRIDEETG